ncbi:hypothetical protein H4582DRAFT_1295642 [Lactarius indigo]|nr:hypothetical protein H4582DRAFT_1295642 [Lactarius indigo]
MSSPLIDPSAYGAVIDERNLKSTTEVTQLNDFHPLVQLHRKFWLQSMQDVPENESMNIDKNKEVDDDKDEGDETGPGCYKLGICIPDIWPDLWVRKEYIRLYEYCNKYLELHRNAPIACLTGHHRTTRHCYWIAYALCRRLTEGKPVIWFRSVHRYLFVKEGVFEISEDYPAADFKTRIWTFVDADDCKKGIPEYLSPQMTKHVLILSSSPSKARWELLGKTTLCSVAIMNPWTREEISQALPRPLPPSMFGLTILFSVVLLFKDLKPTIPRIDEMYNKYGPTPRICLNFLRDTALIDAHQKRYESALSKVSLKKLGDLVSNKLNFTIDGESHTLVLLKRLSRDNFSLGRLEPITHMAKLGVRNQLRKEERAARITLYKSLANVEGARRIAGAMYESLAQDLLEKKIALKLVPMVQRGSSGSGRGKRLPRWDSNHGDDANPSFVRLIDITPVETFIYPVSGLDHPIKDRVYYAPDTQNQVEIDSFIMAEGKLYIFQFTIGSDHPIKKGIVPFFSKKIPGALPPTADWLFCVRRSLQRYKNLLLSTARR